MLCWARPVSITSGPGFQTVDSLPKTQFRETNPHVRPFHASSSSRNHRNSWPASPYPSWAPEGPSSTQSFYCPVLGRLTGKVAGSFPPSRYALQAVPRRGRLYPAPIISFQNFLLISSPALTTTAIILFAYCQSPLRSPLCLIHYCVCDTYHTGRNYKPRLMTASTSTWSSSQTPPAGATSLLPTRPLYSHVFHLGVAFTQELSGATSSKDSEAPIF